MPSPAPASRRPVLAAAAALALVVALLGVGAPRAHAAELTLTKVGDFSAPTYVTSPPGDASRLFVVEKAGYIRVISGGTVKTFLDIHTAVDSDSSERGLLSMAFAPDYASSGLFYVYYTAKGTGSSAGRIHVEELSRSSDPDVANTGSRTVLTQDHSTYTNHNGGQLQFGPDGYLYIGLGDGGGAGDPFGSGQNRDSFLGKILRIDPRGAPYNVPTDNPYFGASDAMPEVWSYGLRNPWRFSFDRATGDLAIGDVGQDKFEEVDFAPRAAGGGRGVNWGWNCYEGYAAYSGCTPPDATPPALAYPHDPACSVTGGYVIRDPTMPGLLGRYVYGDFCDPAVRLAVLAAPAAGCDRASGVSIDSLSSFGEDAAGHVYATSLDGPVYRLGQGDSPSACGFDATKPGGGLVGLGGSDRTAPTLRLRWKSRQRVLRRRAVRGTVTCSERCRLYLSGRVYISGRRRSLKLTGSVRALEAGRATPVRVRLSRGTRRAVGRALRRGKRVRARVRARARDEANNLGKPQARTVRVVG